VTATFTTILLAGDRAGDVLAEQSPGKRKALLHLNGRPMILYVLETLLAAKHVGNVVIVANRVGEIESNADLKAFAQSAAGRIAFREGAGSPATSVLKTMEDQRFDGAVLVTTADNPLLAVAALENFCEGVLADPAIEAAVGLARESDIRPAFPNVRRTYIRLGKEGYSGCNLFALTPGAGPKAARAWSEVEGRRKKPWQLILHFGAGTLLRAVLGWLDLEAAMRAASKTMGLTIRAIVLDDPVAAMDVDRPDHVPVAEAVLASRR
jgi:molybdopterin-guanine dinucleotide biosynthesis protein A